MPMTLPANDPAFEASLQASISALASAIAANSADITDALGRIAVLEASGSTSPSAPTILTAPTVSYPGGSADVTETGTITAGTYSGTILSLAYQLKVNGAPFGSPFPGLTFTVPAEAGTGNRTIEIVEQASWAGGVVQNGSATYTVGSAATNVSAEILAAVNDWWEFEDDGAAGTAFVNRKNSFDGLSIGNGKFAAGMSTTGGNVGRMGRFGTAGPHNDFFSVPGSTAKVYRGIGGWIAPRTSITNAVDRFLLGKRSGFGATTSSLGIWWEAGSGGVGQTIKMVVTHSNGATTELAAVATFTPSGALPLIAFDCWVDEDADLLYLWVNGVERTVAFTGVLSTTDTSLFAIGNGVTSAGAVWDNTYSCNFDVDDVRTWSSKPSTAAIALLHTVGTGYDELVTLADGGVVTPPVVTPPSGYGTILQPFPVTSYANTPIPPNAVFASDTDARTVALRSMSTLTGAVSAWTQWVFFASSSDPLVTFTIPATQYSPAGSVQIRLPAAAHPDPGRNTSAGFSAQVTANPWSNRLNNSHEISGSGGTLDGGYDGHMIIVDPDGKTTHQFYHAYRNSSGAYLAWQYMRVPVDTHTGLALKGPALNNGTLVDPTILQYGNKPSMRAGGCDGLLGLIRAGELTTAVNGPEHVLTMLLPPQVQYFNGNWNDATPGVNWKYPATAPDAAGGTGAGQVIRHGQRFAIRPTVNIAGLGLSGAALKLAYALQKYGCIDMDIHGAATVQFNIDGVAGAADGAAFAAAAGQMNTIKNLLTAVD